MSKNRYNEQRKQENKEEQRMEILKVENLSKVYGKGETSVTAIDHISFSIQEGEFVAIIGPSGSRKIYHVTYFRRSRQTNNR